MEVLVVVVAAREDREGLWSERLGGDTTGS
jgi:hypothetical protein